MTKKIKIKVPKINLLKETPEERKVRGNSAGSAMFSKGVPSKKKLTKKNKEQQRQQDRKNISSYEV